MRLSENMNKCKRKEPHDLPAMAIIIHEAHLSKGNRESQVQEHVRSRKGQIYHMLHRSDLYKISSF